MAGEGPTPIRVGPISFGRLEKKFPACDDSDVYLPHTERFREIWGGELRSMECRVGWWGYNGL
jgi:hypothetical protein